MAGKATDSSRMGITLQGYDQVIALSQANINDTLKKHFAALDAKDELLTFTAKTASSKITADVLPPTVELVDEENKDSAKYIIHLGDGLVKGFYLNEEDDPVSFKLPTNNWELAFDVDFAFEPVKKLPPGIERQIPLPGGYSVKQLMINFGDVTRIVQLDPVRSKFPYQDKNVSATSLQAAMELFLREHLIEKLANRANPKDHNILGYVVNLNDTPRDQKPHFVPTASKVQIVGHRTNNDHKSFTPNNPYNAFCFTEMTDFHGMPSTELKYSGNWFYESIGGTLAMSRKLFWDTLMVEKVKDAHVQAVELSNKMLDKVSSDLFKYDWRIDNSKPSRDSMCGSYTGSTNWGSLQYGTSYTCSKLDHWNKTADFHINFINSPRSTVHTVAVPTARQSEITIQQDITISWKEAIELGKVYKAILGAIGTFQGDYAGSLKIQLTTTISLAAVTSKGELQVTSRASTPVKNYQEPQIHINFLGVQVPFQKVVDEWASSNSQAFKDMKNQVGGEIGKIDQLFAEVAKNLANDLNQTNKFVFPGNGTFDIKDPVFNDHGDLLLGLTYR